MLHLCAAVTAALTLDFALCYASAIVSRAQTYARMGLAAGHLVAGRVAVIGSQWSSAKAVRGPAIMQDIFTRKILVPAALHVLHVLLVFVRIVCALVYISEPNPPAVLLSAEYALGWVDFAFTAIQVPVGLVIFALQTLHAAARGYKPPPPQG